MLCNFPMVCRKSRPQRLTVWWWPLTPSLLVQSLYNLHYLGPMKNSPFYGQRRLALVHIYFFYFLFYFILLYNTLLVLPYIDMNLPRVYMSSQSWTPLPPPTPYHLSGSSPCTSPKHPISCIELRLAIRFLYNSIHVSTPFSQSIPPSPSPTEYFIRLWWTDFSTNYY